MLFDLEIVFNTVKGYSFAFCPQYRAWLRSSFRTSPFNDQEQVGALLSQYTEQQESQRGGEHRWINQGISVSGLSSLSSNTDDDDGNEDEGGS